MWKFHWSNGAEKFGVVSGSIYLRPHFKDSIFYWKKKPFEIKFVDLFKYWARKDVTYSELWKKADLLGTDEAVHLKTSRTNFAIVGKRIFPTERYQAIGSVLGSSESLVNLWNSSSSSKWLAVDLSILARYLAVWKRRAVFDRSKSS